MRYFPQSAPQHQNQLYAQEVSGAMQGALQRIAVMFRDRCSEAVMMHNEDTGSVVDHDGVRHQEVIFDVHYGISERVRFRIGKVDGDMESGASFYPSTLSDIHIQDIVDGALRRLGVAEKIVNNL